MEPVRSSLGGGAAAAIVLLATLLVADAFLGGTDLFVYATFRSLCFVGGEPYCAPDSLAASALTYVWFYLVFGVVWPLVFAVFTWGLPGESGLVHGAVYALILWGGYVVVVLYGIGLDRQPVGGGVPLLVVTLVGYLVYGLVLGGVYDSLAEHRTFLSEGPA